MTADNAAKPATADTVNGLQDDHAGQPDDLLNGTRDGADQETCRHCGCPLPTRRALKDFCSYAHRGAWKALKATSGRTGLIGSKNAKQNKALQDLKRQSVGHFTFARINSGTIRVDGANKRGVGWLMEVGWPGACGSDGWHESAIEQASPCLLVQPSVPPSPCCASVGRLNQGTGLGNLIS